MDDGRSDALDLDAYHEREVDAPRVWTGDGQEIWVMVGGCREDDLLGPGTDLLLCRAILEDGVLVLRHGEPESDPLFSGPSHGDDGGGH